MRLLRQTIATCTLLIVPAAAACQQPTDSRPRIVPLAGARDQAGLFAQRLVLPPDYCSPVHTHDGELHGLILRGTLRLGIADSIGALEVRDYPAGSFVAVPAGRRHVEGARVKTEIYVTGVGPLGMTVVDSAGPNRCGEE